MGEHYDDGENDDDFGLGDHYVEDENDDEKIKKEEKKGDNSDKNKKKKMKKSTLQQSFNNNLFEFGMGFGNEQGDEISKEQELKMEINGLIKENNNLEDKLKLSMIDVEKFKKIIEQKDKEIEELKKK